MQEERIGMLELKVQPDHVHVVLVTPPKYTGSVAMGYLKGKKGF
jgi:REP element-mobilizing transposase RayT